MIIETFNYSIKLSCSVGCWRDPCAGAEHSAGPLLLVHGDEDEEQGLGRDTPEYKDKS